MAYAYKRSETVQSGQITGTLTDYAALFSRTHADFKSVGNGGHVQNANGYDLNLFADSGGSPGTMLDMETEGGGYNAATGLVAKWARVPSIAVGTVVWWQYGDSGISTNQDNPTGVWASHYKGVYHFGDGSTLNANDSSANAAHGTNVNATAGSGQVSGAAVFASTAAIETSPSAWSALDQHDRTISFWLNPSSLRFCGLVDKTYNNDVGGSGVGGWGAWMRSSSDGRIQWNLANYDVFDGGSSSVTASSWWHMAVAFNQSLSRITFYINGAQNSQTTDAGMASNEQPSTGFYGNIGNLRHIAYLSAFTFLGSMDEVRLSNAELTAARMEADYNNQHAPTSFWGLGSESAVGGGTAYYTTPSGTITPAGALANSAAKALSGSIASAGTMLRQAQKKATGAITPTGDMIRAASKAASGTIASAGSLVRAAMKAATGSVTPAGALPRAVSKPDAGLLAPTGSLGKSDARPFAGSTTPAGAMARQGQKRATGALTPSGTLTVLRAYATSLAGTLTPSGAMARAVAKALAGTLTPAGALARAVSSVLRGSLTPAGAAAKAVSKKAVGGLTPSGTFSGLTATLITLTGALSPTGLLARLAGKGDGGSLAGQGGLGTTTAHSLAGSVAPSGRPALATAKPLAGALAPSGALGTVRAYLALAVGALTPAGVLLRTTAKALTGTVVPSGTLARATAAAFRGALTPLGGLRKLVAWLRGGLVGLSGILGTSTGAAHPPSTIETIGEYARQIETTGEYARDVETRGEF